MQKKKQVYYIHTRPVGRARFARWRAIKFSKPFVECNGSSHCDKDNAWTDKKNKQINYTTKCLSLYQKYIIFTRISYKR